MFPIRLALADDHNLFRKTLVNFLSQQESMVVVFQAANGLDLINDLKKNVVDVLLVDLFMPHLNGSETLATIRNAYPELKIIVVSMYTDIAFVSNILDVGIHGYISKTEEPEELLKAINSASVGKIYRNKLLTEALYWGTQTNIKPSSREIMLDDREIKIIQLLWEEKNNKEIADQIFLSIRSIEKIRQHIKEKVGAKTTLGLLKYALEKKIINLSGSSHQYHVAPEVMPHQFIFENRNLQPMNQ